MPPFFVLTANDTRKKILDRKTRKPKRRKNLTERRFTKSFRRFIFPELRLGFSLLKIMRNRVLRS